MNRRMLGVGVVAALLLPGGAMAARGDVKAAVGEFEPANAPVRRHVSGDYATLDPASYREMGEIRVGETVVDVSWVGPLDLQIPKATWAMSLAHAAKLLDLWDVPLGVNELLAFAVQESALGCDPTVTEIPYQPEVSRNGCFNLDQDFDYPELRALFPERFAASQAQTVGGAHFEGAALAFAYHAAVHDAQLALGGFEAWEFYDTAADPHALLEVTALSHAMGIDNRHIERILVTERDRCEAEVELARDPVAESCVTNEGTNLFVREVSTHADLLDGPAAEVFDVEVRWTDVLDYLNSIVAVYPEASNGQVRSQVRIAFNTQAAGSDHISFVDGFGPVLDAIILSLPAPEPVMERVAGLE